jgi:molecular chaperone HscC
MRAWRCAAIARRDTGGASLRTIRPVRGPAVIIGIDLGTTNSLVSVWRNGVATLIPKALGEILTPSVVSFDRGGEILVGAAHGNALASARKLALPPSSAPWAPAVPSHSGTGHSARRSSPLSCCGRRADAEAAYFSDAQRKATKVAGELGDLRVERVLNEPTAAALAYGLHERQAGGDGKILVFDLGGGTFDVSVIDLFDGVMEVRATAGHNFLGGEDFDSAIMA